MAFKGGNVALEQCQRDLLVDFLPVFCSQGSCKKMNAFININTVAEEEELYIFFSL